MIEKIFRMLPVFKGKQRLARFFLHSRINNCRDLLLKGKYGTHYKIPNIKENVGFELFLNGIYEEEIVNFILNKLPASGVMLDIGANIGAILLPICQKRDDISAIGIEASPRVFSYLKYNKEANNLPNCMIINKAVAEEDNKLVAFFSPVDKFGKGSLNSVFTKESETIETISLDTIFKQFHIKKADIIKIDIEGHEFGAFAGGAEVLNKVDAPDIIFEFVDWAEGLATGRKPGDAQQLLLNYGYQLFELKKGNRLVPILSPLVKGSLMIWATKKAC